MLRIPNPGSDISSFIRIFQALFDALRDFQPFSLDDMSRTMVARNLATSSGYMGQAALELSTRQDRSRDPLFNQSKMYSELFRMLGWIHPQPDNRLLFSFTYLGAHVAVAVRDPDTLFRECILGAAYPNAVLEIGGTYRLRPFACVLRTALELDGLICRDEMIVGPLCLANDRTSAAFSAMIARLRAIRGSYTRLDQALEAVSRDRSISRVTMGNYTRFPLAVLEWSGWTVKERRRDVYGRSVVFHALTDFGRDQALWVQSAADIRASDLEGKGPDLRSALIKLGFYQMLERSGFDVSALESELRSYSDVASEFLSKKGRVRPVLFSPFQELPPQEIQIVFPSTQPAEGSARAESQLVIASRTAGAEMSDAAVNITAGSASAAATGKPEVEALITKMRELHTQYNGDTKKVVDHMMAALEYRTANQGVFYPLVSHLFSALGFDCDVSRIGVNYQRSDAFITDSEKSIPIEIKSPGEELFISVKAVRQALENKIILLSRRSAPTTRETTSLAVGFYPPNERAEVASLIADIKRVYDISIGVIDFRSLLELVTARVLENKEPDRTQLQAFCGVINVSDA